MAYPFRSEPGAPQPRKVFSDLPRAAVSPFDFAAIRALKALGPVKRPTLKRAPLPLSIPFPEYSSPFEFASDADLDAYAAECALWSEDQAYDERAAYGAQLDAELYSDSGQRVISESWIERPRFGHVCALCRGDIDLGERHLSQTLQTPQGLRNQRVCDYCASPKGSGGESNAERNGTKNDDEAAGGALCRIAGIGGQAARTKRGDTN